MDRADRAPPLSVIRPMFPPSLATALSACSALSATRFSGFLGTGTTSVAAAKGWPEQRRLRGRWALLRHGAQTHRERDIISFQQEHHRNPYTRSQGMTLNPEIEKRLQAAVKHFWSTRDTQARNREAPPVAKTRVRAPAVNGRWSQMNGFINLVRAICCAKAKWQKRMCTAKSMLKFQAGIALIKKWDLLVCRRQETARRD